MKISLRQRTEIIGRFQSIVDGASVQIPGGHRARPILPGTFERVGQLVIA